jgi:tRNA 2-selenouridine synthase
MTWRSISADELNKMKEPVIVDVRSPCEHEVERIPNSINIPLLSNEERAEVGTIYKTEGEVTARRHALRIISPKIPSIVDEVLALRSSGHALVVHCWRGGLRSEAVASFLSVVGIDCWKLTGGYKAWRRQVLDDFACQRFDFHPIVLYGLTGAGKTEILKILEGAGCCVLDLEGLANHRGSVFGGMGLGLQPTQKNFEGLLWLRLGKLQNQPVILECESRKIGKIALPDLIMERIAGGRRILVEGSLACRARRIIDDYASKLDEASRRQAVDSLHNLRERLGAKRVLSIQKMFESQETQAAVEALLVDYYDPLYQRHVSGHEPYELIVDGDHPHRAATQIKDWVTSRSDFALHQ